MASADRVPVLVVIGPSGAGKSYLGQLLGNRASFLHLELDECSDINGGVDRLGLRSEWDANYFHADASRWRHRSHTLQQRAATLAL